MNILRKVGDIESAILDVTNTIKRLTKTVVDVQNSLAETNRGFSRLEDFVKTSQADIPRQFAEIAAVAMREELAKQRK